jgi:hypothetical protein
MLVFLLMFTLGELLVFLANYGMPFAVCIALIVVAVFVTWLVDVLTVRLVVAGKWKGILGYET